MTKEILEQYADLQNEAKDLRKRIQKTESQLQALKTGGTVVDSVKGTKDNLVYGTIRIEGFPQAEYDEKCNKLYLYKLQLVHTEAEIQDTVEEIRDFISGIEDSGIRQIIRYRIEDGLSWHKVADCIGGEATSESCRKKYRRFLKEIL